MRYFGCLLKTDLIKILGGQWPYLLEEGIANIVFWGTVFYRFQSLGLLSGQGFPAGPTTSVIQKILWCQTHGWCKSGQSLGCKWSLQAIYTRWEPGFTKQWPEANDILESCKALDYEISLNIFPFQLLPVSFAHSSLNAGETSISLSQIAYKCFLKIPLFAQCKDPNAP